MATFVLDALDRFPTGTVVKAYPLTGWHPQMLQPGTGPPVASVETQTMGDHFATFTTLTRGTAYAFAALVSGEWRYVEGGVPLDDSTNPLLHGYRIGYQDLDPSLQTEHDDSVAFEARVLNEKANITDPRFAGGASTGATDNSAALAAMLAVAGGGEGFVPPGKFDFATMPPWAAGVNLGGAGSQSRLHYTGSGNAILLGSGGLDVDDPWTGSKIHDLRITGTPAAAGGVKIRGMTRWRLQDVRIDGFSNGYGVLMNGASFIGRIAGGRIKGNAIGISAKKQAGDGGAGEGQACNAIEICGGLELHNNGWGAQFGDPATSEISPVVGESVEIHGITVEGNSLGGIWVVSAYSVDTHDTYFEGNGPVEYREGAASGNTIPPLLCALRNNRMLLNAGATAVDYQRSTRPYASRNQMRANDTTGTKAFVLAASLVNYAFLDFNFDQLATHRTGSGNYLIDKAHDQGGGAFPVENSSAFLFSSSGYTPTSSADVNGLDGTVAWDANYVYVKFGGSWRRAALGTW